MSMRMSMVVSRLQSSLNSSCVSVSNVIAFCFSLYSRHRSCNAFLMNQCSQFVWSGKVSLVMTRDRDYSLNLIYHSNLITMKINMRKMLLQLAPKRGEKTRALTETLIDQMIKQMPSS